MNPAAMGRVLFDLIGTADMRVHQVRSAMYLMERGADLNCKDSNGCPIVVRAAYHCSTSDAENGHFVRFETPHDNILTALIERGVDVNALDVHGYSALFQAARNGNKDIGSKLMNAGAIHSPTFQGLYPIQIAAQFGFAGFCSFLVDRGVDPDVMAPHSSMEGTALYQAARCKSIKTMASLMCRGADPKKIIAMGDSSDLPILSMGFLKWPLHHAGRLGLTEECLQLLDQGYDLRARNGSRDDPIRAADKAGHPGTAAAMRSWAARKVALEAISCGMSDLPDSSPFAGTRPVPRSGVCP